MRTFWLRPLATLTSVEVAVGGGIWELQGESMKWRDVFLLLKAEVDKGFLEAESTFSTEAIEHGETSAVPVISSSSKFSLSSTVLRRNVRILAIGVWSATKLIERLIVRFIEPMCDNFGFLLLEGKTDDSPDVEETSELPHLRFNAFLGLTFKSSLITSTLEDFGVLARVVIFKS
uniref:Uncharacterized protein n=1 Tax=Glossina pallidipes TaxID=7398 RepID=A0A1A9ZPY0_GLOPL